MTPQDEVQVGAYFNASGKLYSPAAMSQWDRPARVELLTFNRTRNLLIRPSERDVRFSVFGSELHFHYVPKGKRARVVKPFPDLLERFLDLGQADDVTVSRFAAKYGALEIFGKEIRSEDRAINVEYCDVWRYFARTMLALLKIASASSAGATERAPEWEILAGVPTAIEAHYEASRLSRLGDGAQELWRPMAYFVGTRRERDRAMLTRFLNYLLELGNVRPWILWPEGEGGPRMVYSSPRLLSFLALQLCLRIGKRDAFVFCDACAKGYAPLQRAPKAGQLKFCPECRESGEARRFAINAHRAKKRSEQHGEKTR